MQLSSILAVAGGGSAGSAARYSVNVWFKARGWLDVFPWATLSINVLGSLVLGVLAAVLYENMTPEREWWFLLLGTEVCGGFTTFSSFGLDTFTLAREGRHAAALLNAVGQVVIGLAALACARMGQEVLVLTLKIDATGRMSCNPAMGGLAKGQIVREIDALGGEMDRLLGGAALAIDGGAGDALRQPGGEPGGAGDVAGLRTDRVDAAEDDVVDRRRIDLGPLDQRLDRVRAEVGRVDRGEPAAAPPDRGAHRVDDVGLRHRCHLSLRAPGARSISSFNG